MARGGPGGRALAAAHQPRRGHEWKAWLRAYRQVKVDAPIQVDRSGDLVDATEAARMLRYSSRYVIHANRGLGYFPEPAAYTPGHQQPSSRRATQYG